MPNYSVDDETRPLPQMSLLDRLARAIDCQPDQQGNPEPTRHVVTYACGIRRPHFRTH
jgi:hypothetical protein